MSIHNGDTVLVHYTGTLSDGTQFDTSAGGDPLEFVMGSGNLIPGFESALLGREVGDTVEVTIPAAQAYGEHLADLVFTVPLNSLPEKMSFEPGLALQLNTDQGDMDVMVTSVTETHITFDANHPLAGEALTFTIDVVQVSGPCA